jgi:hypothetical protein
VELAAALIVLALWQLKPATTAHMIRCTVTVLSPEIPLLGIQGHSSRLENHLQLAEDSRISEIGVKIDATPAQAGSMRFRTEADWLGPDPNTGDPCDASAISPN